MPALPLVRVRLKHPDAKTFVERFAPNVTRGGVFLASREPRPVGALIRFEVVLVTGLVVLAGEGRVTWVKPYNASEPARPHGMGVQFTELDAEHRPMLERLLERREATGRRVSSPPAPRPAAWQSYAERQSSEPVSNEFDTVEDSALRRALDRARVLATRPDDDDVEKELASLLQPTGDAPATLDQALGELPRFLARGRGSGLFRLPPEGAPAPPQTAVAAAEVTPIDRTPVETTPVEPTPVESTPAELTTPIEPTPTAEDPDPEPPPDRSS